MPNDNRPAKGSPAGLTPQQIAAAVDSPLLQIPEGWRPLVWDFWAYYSGTLKDQLSLCVRLRHWINRGLTFADWQRVAAAFMGPERSGRYRWENELLADLGLEVSAVIRARREREATAARRELGAAAKRHELPASADAIRALMAKVGDPLPLPGPIGGQTDPQGGRG